jgi:hypothetical protein
VIGVNPLFIVSGILFALVVDCENDQAYDSANDEEENRSAEIDVDASADEYGQEAQDGEGNEASAASFGKSGSFFSHDVALRIGESITVALQKGTVPFSSDENRDSPPLIYSPILSFRGGCSPTARK